MPLKRSESRSIYETFTYQNTTTSPQQSHPFTLSEDCNCDVLIVGGGGAGDRQAGGGGGGGAVLYAMSVPIPAGTYTIKVKRDLEIDLLRNKRDLQHSSK